MIDEQKNRQPTRTRYLYNLNECVFCCIYIKLCFSFLGNFLIYIKSNKISRNPLNKNIANFLLFYSLNRMEKTEKQLQKKSNSMQPPESYLNKYNVR